MAWGLAKDIARAVLSGFERHFSLFQKVTAGARQRFENAEWTAVQNASRERIYFYDQRVRETVALLRESFDVARLDEKLWQRVKVEYIRLLHQHKQPELAETFYNSVFCRLFERKYFNNRNIFVSPAVSTEHIESDIPAYRSYYPARDGFQNCAAQVLGAFGFALPFVDMRRDIRNILGHVREHFDGIRISRQYFHLEVLSFPFFRNKAAYIVGKVVNGLEETPFALPILNNEKGGLFVDALLLGEREIANVFSFARAYFMVNTDVPSAVVQFLQRLMPTKTKAELYSAIGLQKHGKTEFYRDFLHHLRHSGDEFVVAPGIRGMVMTVFTLPSFPYVFKVIKDAFPEPKRMTPKVVKQKYQLVKQHDRVGRMADSLEYSYAAFPLERFSPELLKELQTEAASSITFDGGKLVIKHLYIERWITPLNIYMATAAEPELQQVIDDYGEAIKQLAAANIFPGDMLFKNFGVTRHKRVVFYDYDEISYLTECNFRYIPEPPYPEFEMSAEPWYSIESNDVFPEEFPSFLLTNPRIRQIFLRLHADLLDADYWNRKQARIRAGVVEDVFPYRASKRFPINERKPSTFVAPEERSTAEPSALG